MNKWPKLGRGKYVANDWIWVTITDGTDFPAHVLKLIVSDWGPTALEGQLRSSIPATFTVSPSIVKGLVSSSMPASRCPLPTAAFSA